MISDGADDAPGPPSRPGALEFEKRVLVCAPRPRDVSLTCEFLRAAGVAARPCDTPRELFAGIAQGAAAVVVDQEAIAAPFAERLFATLSEQPPWSDLPLIVVAHDVNEMEGILDVLSPAGNVLVLERPMRRRTVLSAVRTALRARRRQYQTRDLLLLAEADRRKNEFLATLGHELRNPLAAIQSAHAVLESLGPKDPQAERPHAIIGRQIAHLSRMVDDLLDVSRIISGKLQLDWQRVDLNEVIERATAASEPHARSRGQTLTVSLAKEPAVVMGDAVRLEQMVTNVLLNATKYTPEGGNVWVSVAAGARHEITVRDDGCGIAPEVLPTIFDAFVQEPTSIARSQGGLGLGLPLVKGLAELHGGGVTASSGGKGRGTTFVVSLPSTTAVEPARVPVRASSEADVLDGRRILLVEDNEDLLEMLQLVLEGHGCSVEVARDGREGVDRAVASRPEIALIDIGLPVLNGYEVAAHIRSELGAQAPLMIAVSGYGQREDRQRAMEAGFDEHLVKPVDTAQLAKVLMRFATLA